MGSNVSRQSSRGLSGRRTQSSGSICRGRHNSSNRSGRSGVGRSGVPAPPGDEDDLTDDGDSSDKVCGSLPSYLDERYAGNNNHLVDDLVSVLGEDGAECTKQQQLNDVVDRIPPLGDTVGAPLHWKFSDGTQPVGAAPAPAAATATTTAGGTVLLCDQGYGSERSPEEEYPPPLPDHDNLCHHHLELHTCYPFITPESTFSVSLAKGSRGLGLSVTGGIDSGGSWPGLIRVKRLFPHQPAASCGVLNVGDLILEANGIPLTGLTNYEALEVLRTAPNQVELRICRPPPDVLNCVSPISEVPPPPPRREQPPATLNLSAGISSDEDYHGEFEITMRKIQGSLGFTLRKEDDSALGHYIRALVREPALKDGRIRAGDKIIAVNDNEISEMSHEEAVQFLRQCGDLVKLRLYRDAAQTPIATLSPTETTPRTSFCKKAQLRQEAVDMLNDIAVRKLIPADIQNQHHHHNHHPPLAPTSSTTSSHRSSSPNTTSSPNRRLRRNITNDLPTITTITNNNNIAPPISASSSTTNSLKFHTSHHHQQMLNEEQFHEALLADGVYHSGHIPLDEDAFNSLFLDDDGEGDDDDPDRPSRPSSLDLYNPNQTPVAARKPKFNFSLAHNAYELNNLDAEILDAPNLTYNMNEDVNSAEVESTDGGYPQEPASMPHIPSTSSEHPMAFSYKNPAYQSAHPQCSTTIENGVSNSNSQAAPKTPARSGSSKSSNSGSGNSQQQSGNSQQQQQQQLDDSNMKKWKGVSMGADEMASEEDRGTIRRRRKPILKESKPLVEEEPKILAIELNRGWNSRLGFSLQGAAGVTYVSAVHADSVAARDGRIKPGDRVLKVNDENVEHLTTNEIIDLLRIVRGPVCIVVSRGKTSQNTLKSNAVN